MRSMHLPISSNPPLDMEVGDRVEIQTKGGQSLQFVVSHFEPAALSGQGVRVDYADIASLKVRRVDKVNTITLSSLGGLAFLFILASLLSPGMQ